MPGRRIRTPFTEFNIRAAYQKRYASFLLRFRAVAEKTGIGGQTRALKFWDLSGETQKVISNLCAGSTVCSLRLEFQPP